MAEQGGGGVFNISGPELIILVYWIVGALGGLAIVNVTREQPSTRARVVGALLGVLGGGLTLLVLLVVVLLASGRRTRTESS